jgi:hypothetical protein
MLTELYSVYELFQVNDEHILFTYMYNSFKISISLRSTHKFLIQ